MVVSRRVGVEVENRRLVYGAVARAALGAAGDRSSGDCRQQVGSVLVRRPGTEDSVLPAARCEVAVRRLRVVGQRRDLDEPERGVGGRRGQPAVDVMRHGEPGADVDVGRVDLDGGHVVEGDRGFARAGLGPRTTRSVVGVLAVSLGLLETSPAQAGIADVLKKRDGLRDAVESVAVRRVLLEHRGGGYLGSVEGAGEQPPRDSVESVVIGRAVFEHCGDGDLGRVERAGEQPPAASGAVDAALIAGVHEAPARAGINGQVHARAEQLALPADAAHVLPFGDAFAHPPQLSPLLRGEQVDEFHWNLRVAGCPGAPPGPRLGAGACGRAGGCAGSAGASAVHRGGELGGGGDVGGAGGLEVWDCDDHGTGALTAR